MIILKFECELGYLLQRNEFLPNKMDISNDTELSISQKSVTEWIGIALKLKFILDNIKRVEALPKDYAEIFHPMIEQIDIPEVSIAIRDEFIPTAQTDNIDWTDEEEEYEEYEEYETFYESPDVVEAQPGYYRSPRAILEKSAKTIQKAWRIHQIRKKEQLDRELDDFRYCRRAFNKWEWDSDGNDDEWAIVIQRVWRGHHLRKFARGRYNGRFHQGRESMRAEAFLAHNVFLYSGVPFPAEQL